MIRRGTRASRYTALGLAFGPIALVGAIFAIWAIGGWLDASDRIRAANESLHELEARRSQAEIYGPLGKNWAEYAASEGSGLMLEPDRQSAKIAFISRVERLFESVEDGDGVVTVIGFDEPEAGLEVLRAEARGRMSEAALPGFLETLEAQKPFVFVEALDVRRAPDAEGRPVMELRLRLSAFRIAGGGA